MPNDNGPKTVISIWAMTGIAFLFMNLRFFCKSVFSRQLRLDDLILLISWILALVYAILIHISVSYGMGKRHDDLDPTKTVQMNKFLFIGEFFTLIAIPVSKTSFSITLLRIAATTWQKWFIWFVIVTVNIVYWLCGILLLVQCQPVQKNWDKKMSGSCWSSSHQDNYSIFAGAYSALLDFVLATFPCVIIYNLQMSRKEKVGVILAMSLGCLAGITAAVKTSTLPGIGKFKDPTFQLADLLIWSNAEVTVTIIAASIPFFRVLLRHITSSYDRSKPPRHSYRLESYGGKIATIGSGSKGPKDRERIGDDDWSERGIMGDGMIVNNGVSITKNSEVTIEYTDRTAISPLHRVQF